MPLDKRSEFQYPAHITGIFEIVEHKNPLLKGSRGAGFSINCPISTTVELFAIDQEKSNIVIKYNDKKITGSVSKEVCKYFLDELKGTSIIIDHYSELPIGSGYGTSGAGALGTANALNNLFKTSYSDIQLAQIAHQAEVSCGTGLGDVIAQFYGKAEIRVKAGPPGIGEVIAMDWPSEIKALTACYGKISTKSIITNKNHIKSINKQHLVDKLLHNPTYENFASLAYQFSTQTGLIPSELKDLIKTLNKKGYLASMIMIGKSLFVLGTDMELKSCKDHLKSENEQLIIRIDEIAKTSPLNKGIIRNERI